MREVRRKRHENELHEKYMQLYHNEQCYEELRVNHFFRGIDVTTL